MNKQGHVLNGVFLAVGLGFILEPAGDAATFRAIAETLVPVTLGALFPDVDTAFGKHRKTLHNFPTLAVFLAYPIYFGNLQFVWIGVATHYVLDVVGSTRGIALFYPFSSQEYGFPTGVTTSSKYANLVTIVVTLVELAVVAAAVFVAPDLLASLVSMLPFDPNLGAVTATPTPSG